MAAGAVERTALWELTLENTNGVINDEGDDSQLVVYRGEIFTRYQGIGGTSTGIRMILETEYAIDGVTSDHSHGVTLQIPDLGIDFSIGDNSLVINQNCKLEIENLAVYTINGLFGKTFYAVWDEMRFYWNGSLEHTIAGSGLLGTRLTGTSTPLFGEPAMVSGGSGPGIPEWENWATSPVTIDLDLSGGMTTNGGCRYKDEAGNWIEWNVSTPPVPEIPSHGPFTPEIGSISTGTNTGSVVSSFMVRNYGTVEGPFDCGTCPPEFPFLTSPGTYQIQRNFGAYDFKDGKVMLLPNVARRIDRINDDYMAVWFRGAFPYSKVKAVSEWETIDRETVCGDVEEVRDLQINLLQIHAELPSAHRTVLNDANSIEAPLNAVPYAPFFRGQAKREYTSSVFVQFDPGFCAETPGGHLGVTPECCPEEPHYNHEAVYNISFPTMGGRPAGGFLELTSDDDTTKYLNFWGNPHWSFLYDFPDDFDLANWWAQGAKRFSADYWIKIRQQWAGGTFLSSRDQRRTRNFLISAPLLSGALAEHIAGAYMGVPTSWVGITRPQTFAFDYPEELELDDASEPNWSATDATLTFDPTEIVVNPSASSCVIELDLSSFEDPPFFGAVPAAAIDWDIGPANVDSVLVEYVNAAGDVVAAFPNGTSLTLTGIRPKADKEQDSEYAASTGQDFADGQIDDEGVDIEPGGQSVTVCSSPERVHDFQYLGGREATLIRFTIEVTDHSSDFRMDYPRLRRYSLPAKVKYETGTTAAIMFGRFTGTSRWGAGFRWGQWDFWDAIAEEVRDIPIVRPIHETPTVLDFLCYRNLFTGVAHDDNLATDIGALYDALEGNDEEAAATNRHAFIMPIVSGDGQPCKGILVNSWSEVPPIACFPSHVRDLETMEPNGSRAMVSYSFAQESRFYCHPNKPIHLEFDNGTSRERWTASDPEPAADSWCVTMHRRPVTNDEVPADFFIVTDEPDKDWINHGPNNGVFAILAPGEDEHSGPWNMVDFQGRYHVAQSGTNEIIYRRAAQIAPLPAWALVVQAVAEANARNPRMAYDPKTLRIFLVYESDEGCREIYSDDDGRTWSAPETMAISGSPEAPTINVGDGGVIRAAVVPGTPNVIGATWQGPGDQSQSAQFTFKDSAAADLEVTTGQFHLVHSGEGNDRWLLTVVIDGETTSSDWWSADNCRTWTRFA